jgi:hypothetical protein
VFAAAHEAGHRVAAQQKGVELGTPLFVPAGLGFLGSFGAITSFRSTVPDRETLLHVAAYGPAFGAAASFGMLLVGLGLSAAGIGDGEMQPAAFQDSLLVGVLGQPDCCLIYFNLPGSHKQLGIYCPVQAGVCCILQQMAVVSVAVSESMCESFWHGKVASRAQE